jgi:hypothetical protein
MKTVILIEDGALQLVLTPETEHERAALKTIEGRRADASLMTGQYYACAGGWTRQSHTYGYGDDRHETRSLILRVKTEEDA